MLRMWASFRLQKGSGMDTNVFSLIAEKVRSELLVKMILSFFSVIAQYNCFSYNFEFIDSVVSFFRSDLDQPFLSPSNKITGNNF